MNYEEIVKNQVNRVSQDETLILDDLLINRDADVGKLDYIKQYRFGEDKRLHPDVFDVLLKVCSSCGVTWYMRFENEKVIYELKFVRHFCHTEGIHCSIFNEMTLDATGEKKIIFTESHETPRISKPDGMFPIIFLRYGDFESMVRDMISAANYIKENLDAGKNRDN